MPKPLPATGFRASACSFVSDKNGVANKHVEDCEARRVTSSLPEPNPTARAPLAAGVAVSTAVAGHGSIKMSTRRL